MNLSDLDFEYPPASVATTPARPSRVAYACAGEAPRELTLDQLVDQFEAGDLLVVNDTRVIPARVFAAGEVEILFLRETGERAWQVLFPAREFKIGHVFTLPGDVSATLTEKGLPQTLTLSRPIGVAFFEAHGEVALPPYIQQARGQRHNQSLDADWYQTAWAARPGSVAAPTASLHFSAADLDRLRAKGVDVDTVTLHVGAGTFLPVRTASLREHRMHGEVVEVSVALKAKIARTRAAGARVWALGTTVTRALESLANGLLERDGEVYRGETKLFIYPPYEFKNVDVLLTNFHQPRSTLLALVAAFSGLDRVKDVYGWAIARGFRLFSYGDLSVWTRPVATIASGDV